MQQSRVKIIQMNDKLDWISDNGPERKGACRLTMRLSKPCRVRMPLEFVEKENL